jgi:hypothetical protein
MAYSNSSMARNPAFDVAPPPPESSAASDAVPLSSPPGPSRAASASVSSERARSVFSHDDLAGAGVPRSPRIRAAANGPKTELSSSVMSRRSVRKCDAMIGGTLSNSGLVGEAGGDMMVRRAAAAAAGLAMTATVGLVGVGTARAVAPATLHITNHSIWTMKPVGGGACQWDEFNTTKDTFKSTSEIGDRGTFSQTSTTIDMTWTAGVRSWTFHGTWGGRVFTGSIGVPGGTVPGRLVPGAAPKC